jgi:hypothetical protein
MTPRGGAGLKPWSLIVMAMLAGCTTMEPAREMPVARLPAAQAPRDCRPETAEVERLNTQLAAEVAERHRAVRAAARREEALRKQLDALKAIERGILEREERMQTQAR